ncbi:RNA polymerase factor sigma-54 [Oricola nitratireducens]|uniref:RNA polymerase factor sigma-54 n=1 Tax=Oricola nitratireducens TaxID=2775868 RepID=UPI0018662D5C|nr:RNA polymerase factor sigma-54 [Oricola nitratireducens]
MELKPTLSLSQKRLLAITPELRQAIGLLQMGASDLRRFIAEQCDKNPFLRAHVPVGSRYRARPAGDRTDPIDKLAYRPSLIDHVTAQIGTCDLTPAERPIAVAFMEALEPSGWLGVEVEEVMARTGASGAACEAVLGKLQELEPTGLFARNLSECLRLQLAERDALDPAMEMILGALSELVESGPARFAARLGLSGAEISERLARIRTLDPKPGAAFGSGRAEAIVPDILVERRAGKWVVSLNAGALPGIEVDTRLHRTLRETEAADTDIARFREAFGTARWIVKAIERRQETLLRIGTELVCHQAAFLDHGPAGLRPLLQKDIARLLKLSESTVSRVANATYIQTPAAVFPLKRFFCTGLPTDGGGALSPAQIQQRIVEIVRCENPDRPLSDGIIAERLNGEGIPIARRTVAKYRVSARIPGHSLRRKTAAPYL